MVQLTGPQLGAVRQAFENAFDVFTFPRFLNERLNRNPYTSGAPMLGDFSSMVEGVARRANQEGWIADLLLKARETVPNNQAVAVVSEEIGFSAVRKQALEDVVKKMNAYLDVHLLITRLSVLEYQVCRIEVPTEQDETLFGTGFLIAPDLVMTNYHVVEAVEMGESNPKKTTADGYSATAANVLCRFDYKRLNNTDINEGTKCRLAPAPQWKYDSSPWQPGGPEDLDYAILRLDGKPGDAPIAAPAGSFGQTRGFIKIPDADYPFQQGSPLWILQHPDRLPLKLAVDTDSVVELSADKSRVTYTTNTEGGSSGSPCFTQHLQPVALHHSGDPNYKHVGTINEGIPLSTIRKMLRKKGLEGGLG